MTTPLPSPSCAPERSDSSASTKATGAEGEGKGTCGECPYWQRDDNPGQFEAYYSKLNKFGNNEFTWRLLDDEPCGWCWGLRQADDPDGLPLIFASCARCPKFGGAS